MPLKNGCKGEGTRFFKTESKDPGQIRNTLGLQRTRMLSMPKELYFRGTKEEAGASKLKKQRGGEVA